jgi:hypothetical protein
VTDATDVDATTAAAAAQRDTGAGVNRRRVASQPAADHKHRPSLGKRLKIRSMVTVAGEVLPFFWPMRNFIHHNPLHGLEHLPFEQAVAEATRLFHARGWLPRTDYQRMLAEGAVAEEDVAAEVDAFVAAWLAEQEGGSGSVAGQADAAEADLTRLLRETLLAMLTRTSQPNPGDREPCAEEVLACLRVGGCVGQKSCAPLTLRRRR